MVPFMCTSGTLVLHHHDKVNNATRNSIIARIIIHILNSDKFLPKRESKKAILIKTNDNIIVRTAENMGCFLTNQFVLLKLRPILTFF